jgi:hypothetical protein
MNDVYQFACDGQSVQRRGLAAIWGHAGFREIALLRYTVPEPASGTFPVELSLLNNRDTRAVADVTISTAAPSVTINLARESRAITVPNLDEPVELQLSAAVSWLDGQAREVTAARLLVNNAAAGDIPIDSLDAFTLPIPNLIFGDNRLEVEVTDSQNLTSKSAPVVLSVTQGEDVELPEELQPAGSGFNPLWVIIPLLLLALGGLGYLWQRSQQPRRAAAAVAAAPAGGSRRRRRGAAPAPSAPAPTMVGSLDTPGDMGYAPGAAEQPFVMAHLEVINAQTLMPEELTLGDLEVRVGRSPAQSQIAFRDDITVSFHAVLRLEGNRYRVYDAGSTSGTFVNGRQVPE